MRQTTLPNGYKITLDIITMRDYLGEPARCAYEVQVLKPCGRKIKPVVYFQLCSAESAVHKLVNKYYDS